MKKNKTNPKAVSPVISTLLVLAIAISIISATLLWGIPYIEGRRRDVEFENSENDFVGIRASINNLIQLPRDSEYAVNVNYIGNSNDGGSVSVYESGTRVLIWYSSNSSLMDITSVDDLTDGDNCFNITFKQDDCVDNVSIFWLNDTCFLAGTKVLMSDGSYKNIENVAVGDKVKCFDEKDEKLVESVVSNIHHHQENEMNEYYLKINDDLCVTPNHMMYTSNGWIRAGLLTEKDFLFSSEKGFVNIDSIEHIYEKEPSYDLTIENYHNYFTKINDKEILVHNEGLIKESDSSSDDSVGLSDNVLQQLDSKNYMITSRRAGLDLKGCVQINFYNHSNTEYYNDWDGDGDNEWRSISRVYLFDLGSLEHALPYIDGTFKNIYENGAVISYDGKENVATFKNEPKFYENREENTSGFRIIALRTHNSQTGGSGSADYKVTSRLKKDTNYALDTRWVYNLSIVFNGGNSEYWNSFFKQVYNFSEENGVLKYNSEFTKFVCSFIVIKLGVVLE